LQDTPEEVIDLAWLAATMAAEGALDRRGLRAAAQAAYRAGLQARPAAAGTPYATPLPMPPSVLRSVLHSLARLARTGDRWVGEVTGATEDGYQLRLQRDSESAQIDVQWTVDHAGDAGEEMPHVEG
jgi:hypothetical protein